MPYGDVATRLLLLVAPGRGALAVVALVAVLSCDSPTAPPGEGERVPVDEIIGGSLNATDTLRNYGFLARSGQEYAAFLEAVEGSVWLTLYDSATHVTRVSVFDAAGSGGLYETATAGYPASEDAVMTLEVRRMYPVDRRPERLPAAITPGDTVAGESIDLPGDIDEVTFSAATGQEFNVFF